MAVSPYLLVGELLCFFVALSANSLLLYLIKTRAGSSFGRYRIMMISFSLYAIFYTTVETLTLPVMHIHGSGILFYVNSVLKYYKTAGILVSKTTSSTTLTATKSTSGSSRLVSFLLVGALRFICALDHLK
ncbi:hypothetical protein CAEBREN_15900 [Caenorhabditis brenneri]|uniref:Uncharacterized protein n=1 Tax=Caenorhabditis brenneri TaxID=135651 RepID=G0PL61_CAEBE|nr:hypothetical protein CAEBREN_15900 [Caenorhabditis brenneri]